MHVVAGIVPDLQHVLVDHGLDAGVARRERLMGLLSGAWLAGPLVDGVWALFEQPDAALLAALGMAGAGAAVGIGQGPVVVEPGPPMGPGVLLAVGAARGVRRGEVLAPERWLSMVSLPAGVGRFSAPEGLVSHGPSMALLKDFREP